jgi:glycosyltransferase involved in cell wall biosynthesis
MRILTLNHEYPPIGGGGGKACQDIASKLVDRGHELVILSSHFKGLPKTESDHNFNLIRMPTARRKLYQAGFLSMGLYIFQAVVNGLRITKKWKPDLIHVHFAVPAGFAAFTLHRLTGIPYLLTTHLGDIPGGSPEKTDKWFRWVFPFTKPIWRDAAKITTVSAFTASLARKDYGITPIIIPNGITVRESLTITPHTPPVILFAGRFVAQKNLDVFIDVLESIRDIPWKCVMLGDGPLFEHISSRVAQTGLSDRFSLTGWVEPPQVIATMDQSDVLFMPSLTEGLPVVGLQALEAGLAIVASNVGGFVDLVENGKNGILCSPIDRQTMVEGLRNLLSNQDKLMHARNYSRELAKNFSINEVVDKYESLFMEISSTSQLQKKETLDK